MSNHLSGANAQFIIVSETLLCGGRQNDEVSNCSLWWWTVRTWRYCSNRSAIWCPWQLWHWELHRRCNAFKWFAAKKEVLRSSAAWHRNAFKRIPDGANLNTDGKASVGDLCYKAAWIRCAGVWHCIPLSGETTWWIAFYCCNGCSCPRIAFQTLYRWIWRSDAFIGNIGNLLSGKPRA